MSPYTFASAFPPDHFISQYLEYASQTTDASHEYHEAAALTLLAVATPDVVARIAQFPRGLHTNLYALLVGQTSTSRKSTAKDRGKDLAKAVWPDAHLASKATPEALAEDLAAKSKSPTLWTVDEFAQALVQMHKREYMAGLSSLLLEIYGGDDYTYKRTSKPDVAILEPHLCIIGCCAETVFDKLHQDDVLSGLLPRFAIVYPDTKPDRLALHEARPSLMTNRNALVHWLHTLSAQRDPNTGSYINPRVIAFSREALARHDAFSANLEQQPGELFARLSVMAMKVAMLSAVGQAMPMTPLTVSDDDMASAIQVVSRWQAGAQRFSERLGESHFEKQISKVLAFIKSKKTSSILRRVVMRGLHLTAKDIAEIEKTLVLRGQLHAEMITTKSGPSVALWTVIEDEQEASA
ncbi:MAG TPA: DUF3987 domain-containing protein [Vicinamibacterales bacterium]|nr:DUF3987 domain-containing protein [Vicinamibacterales bacterium]